MSIKLHIEIESPMTDRDHELLSGIAVMTLAIANHELAEQRFPEAFTEGGVEADGTTGNDPEFAAAVNSDVPPEPTEAAGSRQLCGVLDDPPNGDMICVSEVGPNGLHRGRHKFRQIPGVEVDAVLADALNGALAN